MELVVLSGKGGTGKTTIATAISELIGNSVRVDCDVDAPNMYLFYDGEDIEKDDFIGGLKAAIDKSKCAECGKCVEICRFDAIEKYEVNDFMCEGCGACALICPQNAVSLIPNKIADTYVTRVGNGIISRAEMEIGSDGSGRLITKLRKDAKRYSDDDSITVIDGSPGIGCPVISSVTGSDAVLIVTEPTLSGLGDMMRVIELCDHFGLLSMICVNKYDINEDMSDRIIAIAREKDIDVVGLIPYDEAVVRSINELKPITDYPESMACMKIKEMWEKIKNILEDK